MLGDDDKSQPTPSPPSDSSTAVQVGSSHSSRTIHSRNASKVKVDATTSSMLVEADVTKLISLEFLRQKLIDGYEKTIGTSTRTFDDPKAKENMFADLLKRVFPTWTDDEIHDMLLLTYSSKRSDNKEDVYILFRSITLAYYTTFSLDSIQVVPIAQVVSAIPVPHTFDPSQLEPTPNTPIQDPRPVVLRKTWQRDSVPH